MNIIIIKIENNILVGDRQVGRNNSLCMTKTIKKTTQQHIKIQQKPSGGVLFSIVIRLVFALLFYNASSITGRHSGVLTSYFFLHFASYYKKRFLLSSDVYLQQTKADVSFASLKHCVCFKPTLFAWQSGKSFSPFFHPNCKQVLSMPMLWHCGRQA